MAAVDRHVEPAPAAARAREPADNDAVGFARRNAVGMEKKKNLAAGERPRGAEITRSTRGEAIATVSSRLPPSTTITSFPRARNGARLSSVPAIREASFKQGTTMDSTNHYLASFNGE
jgi:hypothetical protein